MFTEAQKTIIKEVCSIQHGTLTDLLIRKDLGTDEDGEVYEDIMTELGFGRKEFDIEMINTIHKFKEVHDDPELIYTFEELDMLVFKYILHNFSDEWRDRFPKALSNLWGKIFIWGMSNEIHNKN